MPTFGDPSRGPMLLCDQALHQATQECTLIDASQSLLGVKNASKARRKRAEQMKNF
jgi:hypothetical protein